MDTVDQAADNRIARALGNDFDSESGLYIPGEDANTLANLRESERVVFQRGTRKLLEVTDVGDGPRDFDAKETILTRHLRLTENQIYSTGDDTRVLRYAADFTTDIPAMAEDVIMRAITAARNEKRNLPKDVLDAIKTLDTTTLRILLNSAPRNQNVAEKKNGRDFYLALTGNGIEVYAVPLDSLQYIRSKITALFRIPSNGHPLTADGEQFRSSLYGITAHAAPEHLVPLWRKGEDADEKLNDYLPPIEQEEVAYIDSPFRNRRVFSPDVDRFHEQLEQETQCSDQTVLVEIGNTKVRAYRVKNLAEIPGDEWGIYSNVADGNGRQSGYFELNKRLRDGGSIEDPALRSDNDLAHADRSLGVPVRILPRR
jgi:hypothetical protein